MIIESIITFVLVAALSWLLYSVFRAATDKRCEHGYLKGYCIHDCEYNEGDNYL